MVFKSVCPIHSAKHRAGMPVLIYNFLQSVRLLADSIASFNAH